MTKGEFKFSNIPQFQDDEKITLCTHGKWFRDMVNSD
jgi:hypothetical protein